MIKSPESLKSVFPDGTVEVSYANFGLIPYGHVMVGRLFYDKYAADMCRPVDEEFSFGTDDALRHNAPFMVADRGSCSLVTKVRNMERAGAAVGIVVNNDAQDVSNLVMSDDGTGNGIQIPSVLISQADGKKIIDYLETSASAEELSQTIATLEFVLKRPDGRVEYDVWFSSANVKAMEFLSQFGPVNNRLGASVLMTPHFHFQTCTLGCSRAKQEQLCYGSGKYCAHEDGNPGVPGLAIIDEDLRMLCLYKELYKNERDTKKHKLWWDYVDRIGDSCQGEVSESCSRIAHKQLGLDFAKTQ